jgi:hypothetical protein
MHVRREADCRFARISVIARLRWIAVAAAAVTGALAVPAAADVGVELITTITRPGQVARLRAFAPPRMPLYLVTASRAPRPSRCGQNAICEPRSLGPPDHWPYVRLRLLSRAGTVVRFRVPATLVPGRYRAILYCEPCVRGRAGSLVVSGNALTVRS